jgi:hypothetical protein
MAVKSPHPEGEPWVLLADVLAEAAGMDPSRVFADGAEAQAGTMRGVRRDWCGRPCVTWSVAAELLVSLKAEQARVVAAIEEKAVAADEARRAALPAGIPVGAVPEGLSVGEWLMLTDPERQRARRRSVLEDALAHAGTTFTPLQPEGAGQ